MTAVTEYLGKNVRQYGIWGALVAIVILFEILTNGLLLMPNNVASLVQQNAYVMILAIGMRASFMHEPEGRAGGTIENSDRV